MKIEITAPRGIMPKLSAKKLPDQNAQTAQNCDLSGGTIKPFKDNSNILSLGTGTAWRRFFKWVTSASSKYLYWTDADVDVAEIQEVSGDPRIAWTDGSSPKQAAYSDIADNGTPDISEYRALGLQAPLGRPTAELWHTWANDPDWADATNYQADSFVKVVVTAISLKCKKAHTSPTSAEAATWGLAELYNYAYTYWDICDGNDGSLTYEHAYTVGERVYINSASLYLVFKCLRSHLSATADNKPASGTNWQTFWSFSTNGKFIDSVSYVFTYVTDWGEESAPSLPTPTMDLYERNVVQITGFEYMFGPGTITVAGGALGTAAGSGTTFLTTFDVGDWILVGTQLRQVATIATDISLTVSQNFDSAISAGTAYAVYPGHLKYIRVYRLSSGSQASQYQLLPYWAEPAAWVTATRYYEGQVVRQTDPSSPAGAVFSWYLIYECKSGKEHVSGATTEPGVGASWTTYWELKTDYKHFYQYELGMDISMIVSGYWDANVEFDGSDITTPYTINLAPQGVIQTECFDDPPDALDGLIEWRPGCLAGFVGKKIYMAAPFMPYAWPQTAPKDYTLELKTDIVGFGSYRQALIAVTAGMPVVLIGLPGMIQPVTIEDSKAGTSKRNIVSTERGVMYSAPDGVCLVTDTGLQLLSGDVFNRKGFSALSLSNSVALYHDGKYVLFFNNSNTAYVFDFIHGNLVTLTLVTGSVVYATQMAEDNQPLFLQALADGNYHIRELFGSSTNLTATWKSKVFTHKETNLARFQVLGEQTGDYPVTFTLSANGSTKVNGVSVTDEDVWPIGDGMWHETEMQVSATIEIASFAAASSSDELVGE